MDAIRLITVTGARKGEALLATWDQFDLERGVWTKPSHNMKQKRVEHVPLSDQAIAFLKSMPHDGEFLFTGRLTEHLSELKYPWAEICEDAKLKGIRIHDLRHTYASHLVSRGVSLPMVGKLLGHTQPQTAARYAHLADNPLREAAKRRDGDFHLQTWFERNFLPLCIRQRAFDTYISIEIRSPFNRDLGDVRFVGKRRLNHSLDGSAQRTCEFVAFRSAQAFRSSLPPSCFSLRS